MTIENALKELCLETIDSDNDWYSWREIDESRLPSGISLPEGNEYTKNVALKLSLNKEWQAAEYERRIEIINYYISTWGGIAGNARANIELYSNSHPDNLISRGRTGIASWSKALCIYNPYEYAIFDARVSASLNALQVLSSSSKLRLFPVLPSRNNTIVKANYRFQDMVNAEGWSAIKDNDFYNLYLNLLKEIKSKLNSFNIEIYTIEMLLFSKAEELVSKAFPNERVVDRL